MASYWKSQPRKFCDVCKCWLSDNKASIEFHERGKSHKEKKEKQISKLRKKSHEAWKNQQKAGQYLKQMEKAALKKYKQDLREQGIIVEDSESPDETPKTSGNFKAQNTHFKNNAGSSKFTKPKNSFKKGFSKPKMPPPKRPPWSAQVDPEGHTYYWNSETGKSQWEIPEGFVEKLNETTTNQTQVNSNSQTTVAKDNLVASKCPWTEQVSPEGHTYYWNTGTGESQWVKPEGFAPEKSASTPLPAKTVNGPEQGATAVKRPRIDPYGRWSVVRPPKPKKQIDLQLPKKVPNPVTEGVIDRTSLEQNEPEKPKFKEKVLTSLGDDSTGSTVFKKKAGKQRSIRKRIEEE